MRATDLAQRLLQHAIPPGAVVIDATVGNGHDTAWLARCVGPTGRVFGFDVQEAAIAATAARIAGCPQVTLIRAGHEDLALHLPADAQGHVAAVMFNLGFLPGADHAVTTRTQTTLAGLNQALACLKTGGLISLVAYPGHPGGGDEAAAIVALAGRLPAHFTGIHCSRLNALTPAPQLILIERVR